MPTNASPTPTPVTDPTGHPEANDHHAKHRPGEGVNVIPDTGKRGSRPKSDPSPYPPRPTPPPDADD